MKALWLELKEKRTSYLFVAPFLAVFAVFVVIPILVAVGLSFTYFNMIEPPRWVGWSLPLLLKHWIWISFHSFRNATIWSSRRNMPTHNCSRLFSTC